MARLLLLLLLLAVHAVPAGAQQSEDTVVLSGTFSRDLYRAGGRVELPGEAAGDVVVAARTVTVTGLVRGDLLAAAYDLLIRGRVLDDVRAAARRINLDGEVADGFVAAGSAVRLSETSRVGGDAWLAARRLEVSGHVGRELRAAAVRVRIKGAIEGDVQLAARDIEMLPGARIAGNLTYWSSEEVRIAPGATVEGRIIRRQPEYLDRAGRALTILGAITRIVFVLNLFVAGIILLLLFPRLTVSAALTVGQRPGASFGVGLLVLVATPLTALLLIATVIGIPLALALAWLYGAGLLLGFLTAAFYLGELLLRAMRRAVGHGLGARIAALAGALVILALIRFIPIAGPLIVFLALVVGLGAWTLRLSRGYSGLLDDEGVHL